VVKNEKVVLQGGEWALQNFNASPAGFSPVEAITHDCGDEKPSFLALKMQSPNLQKILMHCHSLPQHIIDSQVRLWE
jgi:hypothetical protein